MKIGVMFTSTPTGLQGLLADIEAAEAAGFSSAWLSNIRGLDALTTLALAGQRTRRIELGTNVVPTYPRHPAALAQQALTTQVAADGRLVLGIGLSHRVTMEEQLGFDWSHPIRHMREYVTVLRTLLAGETADFTGEEFRVTGYRIAVPGATPPPILIAALGPQMLRLAGQIADGTAIWMGGPRYLAEHAVPALRAAASEAGRPRPRVLVSVPVCVTDRQSEVRGTAARAFEAYGRLPSYRAILDKQGAAGPADVCLIGDEETVEAGVHALATAGATDLAAAVFAPSGEDPQRTHALLARLT